MDNHVNFICIETLCIVLQADVQKLQYYNWRVSLSLKFSAGNLLNKVMSWAGPSSRGGPPPFNMIGFLGRPLPGRGGGVLRFGSDGGVPLKPLNPYLSLTHWRKMSTKRGLYDISYHNSWYRSRKIKEDSSTEREKSPLQFEPIFITVQCTSGSQDFFLIKMIKKSSNWQRF